MKYYAFDDQYNVVIKKTAHLSSQHNNLIDLSAIDYFQFDFSELQLHNCWKLVHNLKETSTCHFIPQSTDICRLENLSWRKWAQMKFDRDMVSPEIVGWDKETDITWLYGPLVSSKSSDEIFNGSSNNTSKPQPTSPINIQAAVPLTTKRNGSMSSFSSTDTVDSSPLFSDSSDNEDEEHYNRVCFSVDDDEDEDFKFQEKLKPILKHRFSNGPLDLERFRDVSSKSQCKINKSVSFANMVQIRNYQ